jgi:hypothetical protein
MIPLHHIFGFHRGVPLVHLLWQSLVYPTTMSHHRSFLGDQESPGHPPLQRADVLGCRRSKSQRSAALKGDKTVQTMLDNLIAYNNHQISRKKPAGPPMALRQARLPEESLRDPDRILHLRRRLSFAKDPQRHQRHRLSAL